MDPDNNDEAMSREQAEADALAIDDEDPSEALAFLKELPFLIVGALIVAVLVKSFHIQVFWIPSAEYRDRGVQFKSKRGQDEFDLPVRWNKRK